MSKTQHDMNSTHFDQGDIAEVPFFKICLSDERHFHLQVNQIFTLPFNFVAGKKIPPESDHKAGVC